MSFISLEFLVFLVIIVPLYFAIPQRFRWLYLLIASLVFYFITNAGLILLAGILVDYTVARIITRTKDPSRRKMLLALSIIINLLVLFFFKYINFFNTTLAMFLNSLGITYTADTLDVILPLGISFYIFTKIAYIVDVYRGTNAAEQHFGRFALFVGFFPNLTSGPIERAGHLLPQFAQKVFFDETRVIQGLRRIMLGVFKKVVIADRLAIYINSVYDQPDTYPGPVLLLATIFLAFQIYADFSGYTDIALGTAKILGIELFENFQQPYFATSILDFWRRWHISLTSWIREFMFMPLSRALLRRYQGRVSSRMIQAISYLVIMTLIGLWHGANWTFVIWGLLHGFYMGIEMLLPRRIRLMPKEISTWERLARIIVTFALVSFAWIFFRANNVSDALYISTHIFDFNLINFSTLAAPFPRSLGGETAVVFVFILIALLITIDLLDSRWGLNTVFQRSPVMVRWAVYYLVIVGIFVAVNSGSMVQEFVYFQF
jgi:alginate O-acetyltransferase complex protein AlgI